MIPVTLTITGFLSYRDSITIDFSQVDVACISGSNGAGKSSLFDAMTWVLFGRARRNDDALINDACDTCKVALDFDYENDRYRVLREKPRGKGALLEFQVWNPDGNWRTLTEAGLRITEERIKDLLRMDYDTFINASFFLQGKADMFTQQNPAKRKEILGSILGLEIWEKYREETANRRKEYASDVKITRARLDEIELELAEEPERREQLKNALQLLDTTSQLRSQLEKNLSIARQNEQAARLEEEKFTILNAQLENAQERAKVASEHASTAANRLVEYEKILKDSERIETDYEVWLALRKKIEALNFKASEFHALQKECDQLNALISSASARLEQELLNLQEKEKEIKAISADLPELQGTLKKYQDELQDLEKRLAEKSQLENRREEIQAKLADLRAEHGQFKQKKQDAQERLDKLQAATGASCPLCGQDLSVGHRKDVESALNKEKLTAEQVMSDLNARGKALADEAAEINSRLERLRDLEKQMAVLRQKLGETGMQIRQKEESQALWTIQTSARLSDVAEKLASRSFAANELKKVEELDERMRLLGFSPEELQHAADEEQTARNIEEKYINLEKARSAVDGLRREKTAQEEAELAARKEMDLLKGQKDDLQKHLETLRKDLPDLVELQDQLTRTQKDENRLRQEAGGAQQRVDVLDVLKKNKFLLNEQIVELNQKITRLKLLEIAFGKDGVPAMLIEQALPEIESQANELLDRLSNGQMSVSFETEREYKDKNRDDKRQTLDILISDASGRREYELFSGGEAFRINFAIRLALSRVLAGRAGARLRTLVIDEGFGSQDSEGRQRLIEAINQVRPDFDKILVITHLDELKDAFTSRIEVTKFNGASVVEVQP